MTEKELLESRYGNYIKGVLHALDVAYKRGDMDSIKLESAKWQSIRESIYFILGEQYYFIRRADAYMVCSENKSGYLIYKERS